MILDNWQSFIEKFLQKIKEVGIDASNLDMDHLAYQASSQEDYDRVKKEMSESHEFVDENLVGGRRVSQFKLKEPLRHGNYEIIALELIAPKEGQACPSALEHAEFVVENLQDFMKQYPNLNWDTSALNQPNFPLLKLRLSDEMQVKFHIEDILETARKVKTARSKQKVDTNKVAVSTYNKIAQIYTNKYFNDLSDAPFIDKFISLLPQNSHILDIGSGPGTFTKYLYEKGFAIEGVDLSEEMIKIAKEKVPNAKFRLMDMRALNFPDTSFEGLLVAYSLIHIPTPDILNTLKGFMKILRPGGIVLFITQKGEPDQVVEEPFKPGEKMFFNFFTKNRLSDLLHTAGFEIIYQEEQSTKDSDSMSDVIIYTIARKAE